MSNVVTKVKDKYLCIEYTDTASHQWGPLEGQGRQHFSLATAALIPGKVLDRRLGSQEHPHLAPVSAPASAAVCPVTLLL